MNNRIRKVRESLENGGKKLSQEEFGKKLGVSRSVIANIELGRVAPTDLFVQHMCAVFNISENWLRTGNGDAHQPLSRDEELAAFLGKVVHGKDDFRRRFISALAALDVDDWEALEKIAIKLLEETKKADPLKGPAAREMAGRTLEQELAHKLEDYPQVLFF